MGAAGSRSRKAPGQLLKEYQLGDVLGQGAFGVVYLCTKRGSKKEYAVKMVDKVETPLDEIRQECEYLKRLKHPCIVKLHQVYEEKVFICMVMDLYRGGDLIEGAQRCWETVGMIPSSQLPLLAQQLLTPIAWLHQNNCAHRDIKGDNYLMSQRDVTSPGLRLFLSDFGTVRECKPGSRMSNHVGTKVYWAPEFFRSDYGCKVDIWAMGVLMFGMVGAKFPFKGEQDANMKQLTFPKGTEAMAQEFINKALTKKEAERPDGAALLMHPFVHKQVQQNMSIELGEAENEEEQLTPAETKKVARERGASIIVAERRQQLVNRLENAEKVLPTSSSQCKPLATFWKDSFQVSSRKGRTTKFAWFSPDEVEKLGERALQTMCARKRSTERGGDLAQAVSGSSLVVAQILKDHGIDPKKFGRGQAKTLSEFITELQSGSSRMMLDASKHKSMVRVVDIVLLRVVHDSGRNRRMLVKYQETYKDGRRRDDIRHLPGTKKAPHESPLQVAERILRERLFLEPLQVQLDFSSTEVFEDEDVSVSFPGIRTVYRKEIIQGKVTATDVDVLKRAGLAQDGGQWNAKDAEGTNRTYFWLTDKEIKAKKLTHLSAPKQTSEVNALVQAPRGMNKEQLKELMTAHRIDVSKYGAGATKTLHEFSTELQTGESTIVEVAGGRLQRVVDIVVLRLSMSGSQSVLVELEQTLDGKTSPLNRLPAVKRFPDENIFIAAQRLLAEVLCLNPNYVRIDNVNVNFSEEEVESTSYPGFATVYKKRIVHATLLSKSEQAAMTHLFSDRPRSGSRRSSVETACMGWLCGSSH